MIFLLILSHLVTLLVFLAGLTEILRHIFSHTLCKGGFGLFEQGLSDLMMLTKSSKLDPF